MVFSSHLSKLGKGKNLASIMENKNKISIYFFNNGITKKEIEINQNGLDLKRINVSLGYNEVVPINNNILVTRIDKSIGIINNEK